MKAFTHEGIDLSKYKRTTSATGSEQCAQGIPGLQLVPDLPASFAVDLAPTKLVKFSAPGDAGGLGRPSCVQELSSSWRRVGCGDRPRESYVSGTGKILNYFCEISNCFSYLLGGFLAGGSWLMWSILNVPLPMSTC